MFIREIGAEDAAEFVRHLIRFGLPIALALEGGAKVATGSEFSGYREVDIYLFRPITHPFRGIKLSFELVCEIPDVPTLSQLEQITSLLSVASHGEAINRLMYWFWVAAQLSSIARPLFIMDHQRGRWDVYTYKPLWDARFRFGY